MKCVIFSCNTGQGHNSAALALQEAFKERDIQCEVVDTLTLISPKVSDKVNNIYVNTVNRRPASFGRLYKVGDFISSSHHHSPVYFANAIYSEKLKKYILENNIDTVICTHLFPAEVMTYIARKKHVNVKWYSVCTDYTCIPFWEETEANAYFIPQEDLKSEFIRKGISCDKLISLGIPVSERFQSKIPKAEARSKLDIQEKSKVYMVMCGSMGYGNVGEICSKIATLSDDKTNILVFSGNNKEASVKLREKFIDEPRIKVIEFTKNINLYMDSADVLLTKPGGLSTTEAAVKNVPMVHTIPIPGCETKNAIFFAERGMSLKADNMTQAADMAVKLCENEKLRKHMVKQQRKYINANAAKDICQYIWEVR